MNQDIFSIMLYFVVDRPCVDEKKNYDWKIGSQEVIEM